MAIEQPQWIGPQEVKPGLESIAELVTGLDKLQKETGIAFGRAIVKTHESLAEGAKSISEVVGFILPTPRGERDYETYIVLAPDDIRGAFITDPDGRSTSVKTEFGPSFEPLVYGSTRAKNVRAKINSFPEMEIRDLPKSEISELVTHSISIARQTLEAGLQARRDTVSAVAPIGTLVSEFSQRQPRRPWRRSARRPS